MNYKTIITMLATTVALAACQEAKSNQHPPLKIVPAMAQEQIDDCAIGKANLMNEDNYIRMVDASLDKRTKKATGGKHATISDRETFVGDLATLLDHAKNARNELQHLRGWCLSAMDADAVDADLIARIGADQKAYDGLLPNLIEARHIAFEQWALESLRGKS